jgi:phosphatidate cytidylyltransferase
MSLKQGNDVMALELDENLKKRILSAVIIAPVAAVVVWVGGTLFSMLMLVIAVLMAFEWCTMISSKGTGSLGSKQKQAWVTIGIVYIVVSVLSMMYLRGLERGGLMVLFLLLTVWVVDIAAYFSGKIIGGPKILPAISPKKTWAGLIGGMLGAGILNMLIGGFIGTPFLVMLLFGAALAVISQVGDFFESWVKRQFHVKDSGGLIPGHGGILDRVDGLTTTAPVLALMAALNGGTIPLW